MNAQQLDMKILNHILVYEHIFDKNLYSKHILKKYHIKIS